LGHEEVEKMEALRRRTSIKSLTKSNEGNPNFYVFIHPINKKVTG
jgi:hypothetical protein